MEENIRDRRYAAQHSFNGIICGRFLRQLGISMGVRMKEIKTFRMFVMVVIFSGMLAVLLTRLYQIQIMGGETYAKETEVKIVKNLIETGTRGSIYDRNGKLLAGNKLIYTITMVDNEVYKTNRERQLSLNSMIYRVQKIVKNSGEKLYNSIKIQINAYGAYEYTVDGTALLRFKADVFGVKLPEDMTKEQKEITAEKMVLYLAGYKKFAVLGEGNKAYSNEELKKYGLKEEYSREELLNLVGIRYMLSLNAFQKYRPITIARDVSYKTTAYILENSVQLPGMDITQEYDRIYEGGEAFAHILGYTGKISQEELEKFSKNNPEYTKESIIGKAGIEQYMEEILQGHNGERQVTVNTVGREIRDAIVLKKPSTGKDVYLSIDKELQTAVYEILKQNIAGIVSDNLINAKVFNKGAVRDTSEIRIPVYDVYKAFIKNNIIDLKHLQDKDSSELEKQVLKKLNNKEKEVIEKLKYELERGTAPYKDMTADMQEYMNYAVYKTGFLLTDKMDKADVFYLTWKEKKISTKEFLLYGVKMSYLDLSKITSDQQYTTKEEIYQQFVKAVINELKSSIDFEKIIFQNMIDNDEVAPREVCELLYEQGILSKTDADYKRLTDGRISTYDFIKRKINHIEITPAQLALEPCSGSAVVVEAATGKILASVTYPGYDNNRLSNQMDTKYYVKLYNDLSLPFFNRATQQLTAPGSTFKPVTVIAGLEEGVIKPETSIYCDGIFDKVVPPLKCWKHSGHGEIKTAAEALQNSCNDYLSEISYRLGMKGRKDYQDSQALTYLQQYAKLFELNKKSGIEITESMPQVTKSYGIPSAIGQGTHNYTTVQLARYTNTLATRGNSFNLSVIQGTMDKDSEFTEQKTELSSKVELKSYVWEAVSAGMQQFAENNSILKDMKIQVAGKTGTAQESKIRPDHSLFIGYAPVNTPEISIAVRIANGYGSSNATHVGKDIFNYYFNLEKKATIVNGLASKSSNASTD